LYGKSRPPAMAMEYSNLGYAVLGRIVANDRAWVLVVKNKAGFA